MPGENALPCWLRDTCFVEVQLLYIQYFDSGAYLTETTSYSDLLAMEVKY
jgi:hypothetical protein